MANSGGASPPVETWRCHGNANFRSIPSFDGNKTVAGVEVSRVAPQAAAGPAPRGRHPASATVGTKPPAPPPGSDSRVGRSPGPFALCSDASDYPRKELGDFVGK